MAIAFDIRGPIAMFRRPYTTTSSVSFPLPPPTAIAGLLAGIIGVDNGSGEQAGKAEYWHRLKGTKIAVSIMNPITWYSATLNFWNVKTPQKNQHIRVKHQFLKNPCYRIYVSGGIESELKKLLEVGGFIYTPYLGTAYAVADINYLGEFDSTPLMEQKLTLGSVLPKTEKQGFQVDILVSKGVFREDLPLRLDEERALCESITTYYTNSTDGQNIIITSWEGLDVTAYGDYHIAWFPAWE